MYYKAVCLIEIYKEQNMLDSQKKACYIVSSNDDKFYNSYINHWSKYQTDNDKTFTNKYKNIFNAKFNLDNDFWTKEFTSDIDCKKYIERLECFKQNEELRFLIGEWLLCLNHKNYLREFLTIKIIDTNSFEIIQRDFIAMVNKLPANIEYEKKEEMHLLNSLQYMNVYGVISFDEYDIKLTAKYNEMRYPFVIVIPKKNLINKNKFFCKYAGSHDYSRDFKEKAIVFNCTKGSKHDYLKHYLNIFIKSNQGTELNILKGFTCLYILYKRFDETKYLEALLEENINFTTNNYCFDDEYITEMFNLLFQNGKVDIKDNLSWEQLLILLSNQKTLNKLELFHKNEIFIEKVLEKFTITEFLFLKYQVDSYILHKKDILERLDMILGTVDWLKDISKDIHKKHDKLLNKILKNNNSRIKEISEIENIHKETIENYYKKTTLEPAIIFNKEIYSKFLLSTVYAINSDFYFDKK